MVGVTDTRVLVRTMSNRKEAGVSVYSCLACGNQGENLKNREQWLELCAQAAVEQDPDKLLILMKEINRLLEEKEQRLKSQSHPPDPP